MENILALLFGMPWLVLACVIFAMMGTAWKLIR